MNNNIDKKKSIHELKIIIIIIICINRWYFDFMHHCGILGLTFVLDYKWICVFLRIFFLWCFLRLKYE